MAVVVREWLDLIEREYASAFIRNGGAAVKVAVGDEPAIRAVVAGLDRIAERHGLRKVELDAARTKLHMIQDVFFAVARTMDWEAMAQRHVESLFERQGYRWPAPGEPCPIQRVAEANAVDVILLRKQFHQWLAAELMRDIRMVQDFRTAMAVLCQRRLEPPQEGEMPPEPILEWLRGDLRAIGALKQWQITTKVTRHNGRAMLASLCRWLALSGRTGLCLLLDVRQLGKIGARAGDGLRYSNAAVLDAFEVLRQLIDDSEHFPGLLLVVLGDEVLMGDDRKRSLDAYTALKARVWSDVHPRDRDNPLAPLVRVATSEPTP